MHHTFVSLGYRTCPKPGCIAVIKTEEEQQAHTECKYLQAVPEDYLKGEDRIKKQARSNPVCSFLATQILLGRTMLAHFNNVKKSGKE